MEVAGISQDRKGRMKETPGQRVLETCLCRLKAAWSPMGNGTGSYPGGRYYLFSRPPKRVNFSPDNSVYVNVVAVFMIL